ncbi:MAG: hypothetical protein FWF81_09295 [Defluviitaleaceae bacterium]|nr:hypothetical protein [Defluviitaleaceae bacterium]
MIDIAKRDEVIKDHVYCPEGPPTDYTIKKVFDDTYIHGQFHYHMSNCGHQFLMRWDKNMIWEEPTFYPQIEWRDYVFAAVFVHYWSRALFSEVPEWVFKYKFEKPYSITDMPLELWERMAPEEFKCHRYYAYEGGVMYL